MEYPSDCSFDASNGRNFSQNPLVPSPNRLPPSFYARPSARRDVSDPRRPVSAREPPPHRTNTPAPNIPPTTRRDPTAVGRHTFGSRRWRWRRRFARGSRTTMFRPGGGVPCQLSSRSVRADTVLVRVRVVFPFRVCVQVPTYPHKSLIG